MCDRVTICKCAHRYTVADRHTHSHTLHTQWHTPGSNISCVLRCPSLCLSHTHTHTHHQWSMQHTPDAWPTHCPPSPRSQLVATAVWWHVMLRDSPVSRGWTQMLAGQSFMLHNYTWVCVCVCLFVSVQLLCVWPAVGLFMQCVVKCMQMWMSGVQPHASGVFGELWVVNRNRNRETWRGTDQLWPQKHYSVHEMRRGDTIKCHPRTPWTVTGLDRCLRPDDML